MVIRIIWVYQYFGKEQIKHIGVLKESNAGNDSEVGQKMVIKGW